MMEKCQENLNKGTVSEDLDIKHTLKVAGKYCSIDRNYFTVCGKPCGTVYGDFTTGKILKTWHETQRVGCKVTEDFLFKPDKKTIRMFDRRASWRPMYSFDARSVSSFFSNNDLVEKFKNEARDLIPFRLHSQ